MTFDPRHTFRALRHRNFRLFFAGQALSLIGTWLQQVAMGWLLIRCWMRSHSSSSRARSRTK